LDLSILGAGVSISFSVAFVIKIYIIAKKIGRKGGRHCKYNVALRRFLATSDAVENQ
jgi:hypothetical protein